MKNVMSPDFDAPKALSLAMEPRAVLALCHEHADAEAGLYIHPVLATLVPVPKVNMF
jgi:hypothetical protein